MNRERIFRLRPAIGHAFQRLTRLMTPRRALSRAARAAVLATAFVLAAWPLTTVGNPDSPAYEALQSLPSMPRIAVIGDSRPHTGISPKTLLSVLDPSGRQGLTAHNFAVDGTDALHHTSFARNALLKGPAIPAVIIWGVNPLQFDASRKNNRLEQLPLGDVPELWSAGAPLETLLDVTTMRVFAPWRHRPLFATLVADFSERAAIRLIPLQTQLLGLTYEREPRSREYETRADGHVPFRVLQWEDRFKRAAASYEADYAALEVGAWHLALAKRLASRAREAGSRLIFVEMPVSPWLRDHLSNGEKHLLWRRRLQDIAAAEGAPYLDHSATYGKDTQFGDPGHMPLETSLDYSVRLATDLKKLLPWLGERLPGTP